MRKLFYIFILFLTFSDVGCTLFNSDYCDVITCQPSCGPPACPVN